MGVITFVALPCFAAFVCAFWLHEGVLKVLYTMYIYFDRKTQDKKMSTFHILLMKRLGVGEGILKVAGVYATIMSGTQA